MCTLHMAMEDRVNFPARLFSVLFCCVRFTHRAVLVSPEGARLRLRQ
jgi:hypothetical protein